MRGMDPTAGRSPAYLDVASAAPWHPAALAAHAQVAAAHHADPTRRHRAGRAAGDLLEAARAAIARGLGASHDRIAFTSGGTEAAHLAVVGSARANRTRPARLLSTAVEHSSVLAAADASGLTHVRIPVDRLGRVDLDALDAELAQGACLASVQHANHEVGTVQPLTEVAARCRAADVLLHVDACQTVGRIGVDFAQLDADLLTWSAAKFGGGRAGGIAWSPRARFIPLLVGDERERRRRAGLQDLPGIAAMAEALLQLAPRDPAGRAAAEAERADELRRHLRARLRAEVADLDLHGPEDDTLPHLVAASALYCDGEVLVASLDEAGYAVHTGSACATTAGEPSHVLVAMGALTHGHVRVAFGPEVGRDELDGFVDAFSEAVAALRQRAGR